MADNTLAKGRPHDNSIEVRHVSMAERFGHLTATPDQVSQAVVNKILAAETVDDVFAENNTVSAEDLRGRSFSLRAVHINESGFAESIGVYAVFGATMHDTGEQLTITCGAANVVAQAARLAELDALPIDVEIVVAARPTARGYYPMSLRRAHVEEGF